MNRFTAAARFSTRFLYKIREGVSRRFLRQSTSKTDRIPLNGLSRVAIRALIIGKIWVRHYPHGRIRIGV